MINIIKLVVVATAMIVLFIGMPMSACRSHNNTIKNLTEKTINPVRVSTDINNPNLRCPRSINGVEVHAEWQVSAGVPSNLRCVVGY